jgi:hypothetical protein
LHNNGKPDYKKYKKTAFDKITKLLPAPQKSDIKSGGGEYIIIEGRFVFLEAQLWSR